MSLNQYIIQRNSLSKMFGGAEINPRNLTRAEAQSIASRIESDLEPENLTCDGELSGSELRARRSLLQMAQRELFTKFPELQAYAY
jgi:hypothetical protein